MSPQTEKYCMQTFETARHLHRDIWIETFAIGNFFALKRDTGSLEISTASHRVFMQMKLFSQEKTLTVIWRYLCCITAQLHPSEYLRRTWVFRNTVHTVILSKFQLNGSARQMTAISFCFYLKEENKWSQDEIEQVWLESFSVFNLSFFACRFESIAEASKNINGNFLTLKVY